MGRRYVGELRSELAAVFRMGGAACLLEFIARLAMHAEQVVRTRSLAVVDRAMGSRARAFRAGGQIIRLQGAVFGGAREIYGRNVYGAAPGFDVQPGDVVVDLGANAGLFTVLAARRGARVVAVEAQSGFVDEIQRLVRLNGCAERTTVEVGLLGTGTGFFGDAGRLRMSSHYGKQPPPLAMAELIRRRGIDRIDLLKIDIEGSEFGLFGGDLRWLACVRRIAMEVHSEFGDPDTLAGCLAAHGFAVSFVDNRGATVSAISERGGYLFAKRPD
jgi:FkbM family methyltransferase